jgi:hypothetical protein
VNSFLHQQLSSIHPSRVQESAASAPMILVQPAVLSKSCTISVVLAFGIPLFDRVDLLITDISGSSVASCRLLTDF